ncbi:MAG TPA: M81 family metallopeptidase [Anaerolineae bacterium]|nr:M81 family metallopeptidase [Anaerolineae bacterium]
MRIAIGQLWQETNTFSPFITERKHFQSFRYYAGEDVLRYCSGGQEIGGFVKAAQAARAKGMEIEYIPLLAAGAWPAGRLREEFKEQLEEQMLTPLRAALPVDGVLLSLHGALASEKVDDVDGEIVKRIRALVGNQVPISISLDHHANITQQIVDNVNALVGYQSLPHIDMLETGQRAAELLFAILRGEIAPTIGWRKIPMITPADRFLTGTEPLKLWFDRARELERQPGVLSISLFPVQPWLDVEDLGWSAVVITDNDPRLAEELAQELAELAWSLRQEFFPKKFPTAEAISRALEIEGGPIVIADGSDSVNSGAPGDSTWLLKELVSRKLGGTALITVVDPEAVAQALAAGIGREVTVNVGGKRDRVFSTPIQVTGRVIRASDGKFTITGHLAADINMGRTVVLDLGEVKLVISEEVGSGHDPMVYRHLGLEPSNAKIVVVKTPVGFWLSYRGIMQDAILADCPGLSTSNLKQLPFKRATRPLFPLDPLEHWDSRKEVLPASA